MMVGLLMGMTKAIAQTAVGRGGIRDQLVALAIVLGLGHGLGGCALSHERPGSERADASWGAVLVDAGPPPPDARPPDAPPLPRPPVRDASVTDLDLDGDGYPASVDCNDHDATIHPGAVEFSCGLDGIDHDCDGWDLSEECESDPVCLMWLCNG
jgi:hypothetical protein